jgi:hypothetical protein
MPMAQPDHIDGNGLNNQRSNLRASSQAENMRNRRRNIANVAGFKGVSPTRDGSKWRARIWRDDTSVHLGTFATPEGAARAYDAAAMAQFGDFARLNFPMSHTHADH